MPSIDTAVVLAAGRGTRMGALTAATPKPLLMVAGQSIIARVLGGLARGGVRRAVVVTGYLGEQIEAALGDGGALGLSIAYRRQERPDGTARALLLAESLLGDAPFVVSWGDILVPSAFYGALLAAFARWPCDALLAVNAVDDPWRGAAVYVDPQWRVERLEEKPPRGSSTTGWNNAGIMAFAPLALDYARRLPPSPRGEYELPQAVARMVGDGRDVRALAVRGPWSDVGTPEDLAAAQTLFAEPRS
ncbi:MAG TPA: nucleotidyltransferase family protein [Candidatus Dormibacteraeota bacterium]|nr:nucleotidyltransferase family protein [Candidatus Dormibacteraeota bacterium]